MFLILQVNLNKKLFFKRKFQFIGGETCIDIFNKKSPCKKIIEPMISSPKREIIRFTGIYIN